MVIKWAKLAKQDLISFCENTSKTKRNTKNYISLLVSYIENLIESPLLGKFLFHVEPPKYYYFLSVTFRAQLHAVIISKKSRIFNRFHAKLLVPTIYNF